MSDGKKYYIAVIAASSLLFTYLHYSTTSEAHSLHDIYRELYYIPVFLGALVFGLRGAILSFLLGSVLYAPSIYLSWTERPALEANKFLHLFGHGMHGGHRGHGEEGEEHKGHGEGAQGEKRKKGGHRCC